MRRKKESEKQVYQRTQESMLCELLSFSPEKLEEVQAFLKDFGFCLWATEDPKNGILYVFLQKNGSITPLGVNSHRDLVGFAFRQDYESVEEFHERVAEATDNIRQNNQNDKMVLEEFSPRAIDAILAELSRYSNFIETGHQEDLDEVRRDVLRYLQITATDSPYRVIDENSHWSGEVVTEDSQYIISPADISIQWADTSEFRENGNGITMWGWEAPRRDKDPISTLIPYGNVVGIVVVPNSATVKERKNIAKQAMAWKREHEVLNRSSMILTVDKNLLERWIQVGSPFVSEEEMSELAEYELKDESTKKQAAYGLEHYRQREEPPEVSVDFWEPMVGSHIGSPQIRLNVKWDETYTDSILIDWGWIFSMWKSKSFIDFPQASAGIIEFLNKKLFRPVKRLYRTDLLVNSLDPKVIYNLLTAIQSGGKSEYTIDEFVLLELYHRLGQDGLLELMQTSERTANYTQQLMRTGGTTKLFKYLNRREKEVYAQKSQYHGLFITHAHQDHTLGSSIIRSEIPRYLSDITQAFLETDFLIASRWLVAETAAHRQYNEPMVGSGYQIEVLPHQFMEDGMRVEVAPGIFITAYSGHHSVPGALGYVWEVYHHGKLLSSGCYGGDDKDGHFYRQLQEHVKNISPIGLAVIEGTNDNRTAKETAFTTEDDVQEAFSDLFNKADRENALVIVDVLKNNFTRLFNLVNEGKFRGRTIVLSPKIALRCYELEQALSHKLNSDYESNDETERKFIANFREFLYTLYSGEVRIWKRSGSRYETYEKQMFEQFGTIGVDQLSSYHTMNDEEYLLIREVGEQERKIAGIGSKKIYWVRSSSQAHDETMKEEIRRQAEFAKNNKMIYFSDPKFHTSGHGVNLPYDHPQAEGGLLDELVKCQPRQAVVVHTEGGRQYINQLASTYPGSENIKMIGSMKKPNPTVFPEDQFDYNSR